MDNIKNIKYNRQNYDEVKVKINELISNLVESTDFNTFLNYFKEIIKLQNHIEEMFDYCDIQNMRHQNDEKYIIEMNYWNESKTKFDLLFSKLNPIVLESQYLKQLKEYVPSNYINILNYEKISTANNLKLKQREQELICMYKKIKQEKINFKGEELSLVKLSSYFSDDDRNVRKEVHDLFNDFYLSKQKQLDDIYFELIKVRNEIAHSCGMNNYLEYSIYKLKRIGYNYKDINKFRNNIIKYIVPVCSAFKDKIKEKLEIEELKYYDSVSVSGTPKLKYYNDDLLQEVEKCLEFNKELQKFYLEMLENGYIDATSRDDKVGYSITNYLTESCIPTITCNFKSRYTDIKTLMHELGHAYQKYNASKKDKDYTVSPLLKYPSFEIAEMFSYAMELISLDYISELFENDYDKYIFMEYYNLISNMPYIAAVDEFQQRVYTDENLNSDKIRKVWKEMVIKYGLNVSNSGHKNLDEGGYIYRQIHIFTDPFYYIDYALSYFGAVSIADSCRNNLDVFNNCAKEASYLTLKEFIDKYNLSSPFDENNFKKLVKAINKKIHI